MIGAFFIARAFPGFGLIADGMIAVSKGTYNSVQVFGIAVGLIIVVLAGVFTIRSNVAKIWREQAEGEKARNVEMTEQLAAALKLHASELAEARLVAAAELAKVKAEAEEQRALKHAALTDLSAANMRTDLGPLMKALGDLMATLAAQHRELIQCFESLKPKEDQR